MKYVIYLVVILSTLDTNLNAQSGHWVSYFKDWASPYGEVSTIVSDSDDIFIGGYFFRANLIGRDTILSIAKWDNVVNKWQPLIGNNNTNGILGSVASMKVIGRKLIVGGRFLSCGGVSALSIGAWDLDSNSWSNLGDEVRGKNYLGHVNTIEPNDSLFFIGGSFDSSNTYGINNVAMFNGYEFEPLGNGVNGTVYSLLWHNGYLYVGGSFDSAGTIAARNIARWDGSTWEALGEGVNGDVKSLLFFNNRLVVGGLFDSAGVSPARNIASWNNTSGWKPVGTGLNANVNTMVEYKGKLVVGGGFWIPYDSNRVSSLAMFTTDSAWINFNSGVDGGIYSLFKKDDNTLLVAGEFLKTGTVFSSKIGYWVGDVNTKQRANDDENSQQHKDEEATMIRCYPNPADNLARISIATEATSERYTCEIYNTVGELIAQPIVSKAVYGWSHIIWNCESISSGLYYVILANRQHRITQRLLIIH